MSALPLPTETLEQPTLWNVIRHDVVDSTNLEAHRLVARGGCAGPTAIVSERQTAGYGRHDRVWESAAGKGLWASFVLPAAVPAECLAQASLVLGVAAREAIADACGVELANKWPNDLLHNGRKCCGLLCEAAFDGPVPTLILGTGINVNHRREDFSGAIGSIATSIREVSGREHDREALLAALVASIGHWFARWERRGFAPVREAWLAGSCTMGREVALPSGYGASRGIAVDIDAFGRLVVRTPAGAAVAVDSGEILFK